MVSKTSTEEIPMTATARPSTAQVAQELVALCRAGRNLDAVNKLYSPKIVSIEPVGSPEMPAEMRGFKPTGQRETMTEMALYTVKDGKIVEEQFFYHVPGK
jgi:hypothetical protein